MPTTLLSLAEVRLDANGSIVPCFILNRGIDKAAREGNADFRLELSITFSSNGQTTTEAFSIPVAETRFVRDNDTKSVLIDTTLQTTSPVDQGTQPTAAVELVRKSAVTDPGDPIADPTGGDRLLSLVEVTLDPAGSIVPCFILNRGIDTAARQGNAPFRLGLTVTFTSNGQSTTESFSIPVAETRFVRDHDAKSVVIDATVQTTAPVDQGSALTGTVQLFHKQTADFDPGDPIGDPIPFP